MNLFKKSNGIYLSLIVIFFITLISCDQINTIETNKDGHNIPLNFGQQQDIKYSLIAYQSLLEGVALSQDDTLTYSRLLPSNINFYLVEQADSVCFNKNQVDYFKNGEYYNFGDTIIFQPNTWNFFDTYGNNNTPTIHDSILSPNSFSIVSYPLNKGIINKNSDLTITWNSDNSSESVIIMISPETTSDHDGIYIETTDTGSYTVTSSQLSELPLGKAGIDFMRGYYKIGVANDNNNYLLSVWSEHQLMIFIVE